MMGRTERLLWLAAGFAALAWGFYVALTVAGS